MNKLFYLSFLLIFFITPKSYAVNICPSGGTSTADSGTIYDSGGEDGPYSNNENCGFLIQPTSSPSDITLSFFEFSVEPPHWYWGTIYDYLEIYDGTSASGTLLGRFYGATRPSSVTATSGSMYLRFISDSSSIYSGFTATWTSSEPELIASYNFDDDWITNNSLTDQTGSYNGNPGGSISRVLAGASSPKGDTCYAGSFSGGDIDITGLPVSTAAGAKTSVSFWMNWDGTDSVMPMGWYQHDLWLISGIFGFNTWGSDVTGIFSSGLSSGWHHVTAVFTNGSVSNNKLYIDGVLKAISYKGGTIYSGNAIVQSALRIGGVLASNGFNFRGMIDNFKIYTGEISQAQVMADMNESNACPTGGNTTCVTFRDEFSTESYSRQDGTANWATNWNEVSDNGSASTGTIEIANDKLRLEADGAGSTILGGPYIEREADLSSYTTATLSFDYSATEDWADEENDEVEIYASSNGGSTWTLIHTFTGTQSQSTQQFSQDISAYIANNTRIALVEKGIEDEERFYFDNVQIEACAVSGGGDTPATNFNCVENGTNGITGNLYTKTTAQSFNFDIVALQDASTIETGFASGADHIVTVELVNAETTASCSSHPALSPAVSQTLNITASDTGTKTSASMSSSTAYRKVKCRVTDVTDSPSVIGCSTDSFAIRPTTMTISSNLTNTFSAGLPKAKAGEDFTLIATATAGYNGTPNINNANLQAHVGAIQTGSISGTFIAANSATGIATGSTFSYSEVGLLQFDPQGIYDDSFTAIDQAGDCTDDFSNTVISGKVGCKFGNSSTSAYFGRFTPDHFRVFDGSLINRNSLSCSPVSNFTYTGELFQTSFKLSAKNSNNIKTKNYIGDYAKLDTSVINNFNFGAIDLATTTELTPNLSLISSSGPWVEGKAIISASMGLTRTTPHAPFESFSLGIAPKDSDNITVANYNLDTSVPSDSNDRQLFATTKIRFGRLNIKNAHGSELSSLSVPITTEFFDGSSFITHTDDSCTTLTLATHLSISDPKDTNCTFASQNPSVTIGSGSTSASPANLIFSSGEYSLQLSAPGSGNVGFIDITSGLSNRSWLEYDWDADNTHDNCPSARATFGIYKGNSKQIYFREVY